MAWNKDLAKLKQELKAEERPEPKRPVPKAPAKPAPPRELAEEDALFLSAMGKRRQLPPSAHELPSPEPPLEPPPPPAPADFAEAMSALKGLKPVRPQPRPEPAAPVEPPPIQAPELPPPAEPVEAEATPRKDDAPAPQGPTLIQLAAGMAIDVDGTLDLRGHSPLDAVERLKERILDGHLLGWRTLHVQLGASDELRQALLAFLSGPEAALIVRYAQAPIPMGGSQAWIFYLGLQGPASH